MVVSIKLSWSAVMMGEMTVLKHTGHTELDKTEIWIVNAAAEPHLYMQQL